MLVFIGLAAESGIMLFVVVGLFLAYLAALLWLLLRKGGRARKPH
jgi:high-affinity Fe2+/Pb2+ permease